MVVKGCASDARASTLLRKRASPRQRQSWLVSAERFKILATVDVEGWHLAESEPFGYWRHAAGAIRAMPRHRNKVSPSAATVSLPPGPPAWPSPTLSK